MDRMYGLQAGRAFAAIWVAAAHANVYALPERILDGRHAGAIFTVGHAGVDFFFALSGFIMVAVHRRDFSRPAAWRYFITKRVARIYPFYWLLLSALLVLYFLVPARGPVFARETYHILTSYLLWPTDEMPIIQVAWTLRYEMLFYLAFSLLILNHRLFAPVLGVWFLACAAATAAGGVAFPGSFLLSVRILEFAFGMAAAFWFLRHPGRSHGPAFLLGAALFFGAAINEAVEAAPMSHDLRTLILGLGAALSLPALAAVRGTPRWAAFVGDASYAIYLLHPSVLAAVWLPLKLVEIPPDFPPLLMLALVVGACIAVGCAAHVWVERPLLARLSPRRPVAAGGAAAGGAAA